MSPARGLLTSAGSRFCAAGLPCFWPWGVSALGGRDEGGGTLKSAPHWPQRRRTWGSDRIPAPEALVWQGDARRPATGRVLALGRLTGTTRALVPSWGWGPPCRWSPTTSPRGQPCAPGPGASPPEARFPAEVVLVNSALEPPRLLVRRLLDSASGPSGKAVGAPAGVRPGCERGRG